MNRKYVVGILLLFCLIAAYVALRMDRSPWPFSPPPFAEHEMHAPKKSLPRKEPIIQAQPPDSRKSPKLSINYPYFEKIETLMETNRGALAQCLLRNPQYGSPKIDLELFWQPSGAFKKLSAEPDPGSKVTDCMQALFRTWDVPAHPALQPFSYKRTLLPSK